MWTLCCHCQMHCFRHSTQTTVWWARSWKWRRMGFTSGRCALPMPSTSTPASTTAITSGMTPPLQPPPPPLPHLHHLAWGFLVGLTHSVVVGEGLIHLGVAGRRNQAAHKRKWLVPVFASLSQVIFVWGNHCLCQAVVVIYTTWVPDGLSTLE